MRKQNQFRDEQYLEVRHEQRQIKLSHHTLEVLVCVFQSWMHYHIPLWPTESVVNRSYAFIVGEYVRG